MVDRGYIHGGRDAVSASRRVTKAYRLEAFLGTTPSRQADITYWVDSLAKSFQGFNLANGIGYWLGQRETSMAIVVRVSELDLMASLERLKIAVAEYCKILHQDCVMLTVSEVRMAMLVGENGEI